MCAACKLGNAANMTIFLKRLLSRKGLLCYWLKMLPIILNFNACFLPPMNRGLGGEVLRVKAGELGLPWNALGI